jgi:hypothetical protein
MAAPIGTMDEDGVGPNVLFRVAARRNHGTQELDTTYALDLDTVVDWLTGLLSVGNATFGRAALQAAMAARLGVPDTDRDRAVKAVDDALGTRPAWLQDDPDGYRIVDRD